MLKRYHADPCSHSVPQLNCGRNLHNSDMPLQGGGPLPLTPKAGNWGSNVPSLDRVSEADNGTVCNTRCQARAKKQPLLSGIACQLRPFKSE